MRILPAGADSGIRFRRTDLPPAAGDIAGRWDSVVDTRLCTVLGNRHGTRPATVEHLMAALSGAGVDNAVIEIDAPQIPAMDGRAAPFLALFAAPGTVQQQSVGRAIPILEPDPVVERGKRLGAYPGPATRVPVTIALPNQT